MDYIEIRFNDAAYPPTFEVLHMKDGKQPNPDSIIVHPTERAAYNGARTYQREYALSEDGAGERLDIKQRVANGALMKL